MWASEGQVIFRTAFFNAILLTALVGHCDAAPQQVAYKSAKPMEQKSVRQTVESQIAQFNNGNLQQAAQTGYEILRRDPGNSLARYYYAQTLYKLNCKADAKSQFAECYKITSDLKMKANCYDALKALAAQPSGAVTGVESTKAPEAAKGAAAEISTHDPALASRKLQVMIDGAANIAAKRKQLAIEIQEAKDRAAEQLNGIEQYFERAVLVNNRIARVERYENPEYSKMRDRTQRELQIKIDELNADFTRREAEILADCRARGAVYDEVRPALKTQQKPGTSQIQIMPQNTNGFVRHYVNYDGNDPVSLKARQGELTNSKAPAGIGSTKGTQSVTRAK